MRIKYAMPLMAACVLATAVSFIAPSSAPAEPEGFPGWPSMFEGRQLMAAPLSLVEQRFAESFPGRIGRFSDGGREVILRWITVPTRKLHPAWDCFRGSGYHVKPLPLESADGGMWGAFTAERGTQQLLVREVITDDHGNRWTDVSGWYWAAVRGETQGPWWAITVAASGSGGAAQVPLTAER
jgi:hypothetical protein